VDVYNSRDLLYLVPLGFIGLFRWACWVIMRIPASFYRPIINDHRESLSIVVPVYQEDPEHFALAIESWLRNNADEVILVIDSSDTTCLSVAARYPVTIVPTDVPGKRDALRKGWEVATSSIVALVDSDTVWADDVADKVLMPFADPDVGGVATRQNVYKTDKLLQRINDMFLDYRYFDENAAQTVMGRALSCVSGRTAVYRRDLLLSISDRFMAETFLGIPCMSGDDKCLTRLIHSDGHRTVLQRNARVWSTFPDSVGTFYRQRLRWSRNTWRSDLAALFIERWAWRHKFLAWSMIYKATGVFTILISPIVMTIAIAHGNWSFVLALTIWWLVSRTIKVLPHLRRRPKHIVLVPVFIMISFAMALVKIQALVTIKQQKWLTRQVEVKDGQVVRTGDDPGVHVSVPVGPTAELIA
jgi:cellulose synthase/poly-beta-1,6-N-acetylglucosamine synthase-like glycosyltransferase